MSSIFQLKIFAIVLFMFLLVPRQGHAQYARKDLPKNLFPQNNVTSFHRRAVNSTEDPWRSIGRVNIGGRAHCSGTLVAENIVLTAAHCMFSKTENKMVVPNIIHFLAGYSKGEYQGHSKIISYVYDTGFSGEKGATRENLSHDWALLTLEKPLGKDLGFLTMPTAWAEAITNAKNTQTDARIMLDAKITTAGYPGDRAHVLSLEEECGINATANMGHILFTSCIALKGDSGGPILQKNGAEWNIIGVQTASTNVEGKVAGIGVSALAYSDKLASVAE